VLAHLELHAVAYKADAQFLIARREEQTNTQSIAVTTTTTKLRMYAHLLYLIFARHADDSDGERKGFAF
jgi:hypothetical protein